MSIKLPDSVSIDDWYVADTVIINNDFDEGPLDIEWDQASDFGGEHIDRYLGKNWRYDGVEMTWDGTWENHTDDEMSTITIGVFGKKEHVQRYWQAARDDHNLLTPPRPAGSLDSADTSDFNFYESMKDSSPTRQLIELAEAGKRKPKSKKKPMSPEEWAAFRRKESDDQGYYSLSIDVDDEDGSFEKAYYRFVKRKAKKHTHAVNYGGEDGKIPSLKTKVYGGAVEWTMTFHSWQDAEEFLEKHYGGGMPRDEWEDAGMESLEFYMYGEDPAAWG